MKVHRALSLLFIHTRFDDITRSRGWNKFQGLRVDCALKCTVGIDKALYVAMHTNYDDSMSDLPNGDDL